MEKTEIKTIEMIRRIREAQYEQLKDKTTQERIAFYREKAQRMNMRAKAILQARQRMEQSATQDQKVG
jgi:hypothetical protein